MNKRHCLFVVLSVGCEYAAMNAYFATDYKLCNNMYYGITHCTR